jgi:bifunctional NMN adenylyltransferase/nudix hydrolase
MALPGHTSVGVIIGRFQIPALHEGHKRLFETVFNRHKRVVVLLGIPAWLGGTINPLDYQTRKAMILEDYPNAQVEYIKDCQTNEAWSRNVDNRLGELYPFSEIILYGGRKGFTGAYCGKFQTIETLEDPKYHEENASEMRKQASVLPLSSKDFRTGVIYGAFSVPEGPQMCIDGAVLRELDSKELQKKVQVLLIAKANEKMWRFPGGKLDNGDVDLEAAILREVREETGLEVSNPRYIASGPVKDWRADRAGIQLYSALFVLDYVYGAAKAQDDAALSTWLDLEGLTIENMEECHRPFLLALKNWYNTYKTKEIECETTSCSKQIVIS